MVAINSFREGKIPPDWMPEHAQALEKKDGKKREWYNPEELVRNGKMTEKEFKRYQNQVGTLRAGYIAQMFAKIGYTVYMAAKTGNYEETSSEEVPKINTKTEIMGQRTVFINDGTPQGTAKAIQTVSGNTEITELKTYIPQTGETIIRTRINATGDIFENVLYNTGSSISGAAQKPLAQIENSVYNTFGDISKPVVTGKVSSNNLLAEYSVKANNIPALYNPNYVTFQKGDYLNSIRVVNRDGSSNIPKGQGYINIDNRPYLNGSRPSFRKDFAQNLYDYYKKINKIIRRNK